MEKMRPVKITALFFFPGTRKPYVIAEGLFCSTEKFVRSCLEGIRKLSGSIVQGKIVVRVDPPQQGEEEYKMFIRNNDSIYDQMYAHFEKFFDEPK